jgi:hypothetical protein
MAEKFCDVVLGHSMLHPDDADVAGTDVPNVSAELTGFKVAPVNGDLAAWVSKLVRHSNPL